MSLESKIDALIAAVEKNTAALLAAPVVPVQAPVVAAPVQAAPPPVQAAPAAPATPALPPPPSFLDATPAAPAAPVGVAPFTEVLGLIEYMKAAYARLGPAKGVEIGTIMAANFNAKNPRELSPENYAAFYAAVEAL